MCARLVAALPNAKVDMQKLDDAVTFGASACPCGYES